MNENDVDFNFTQNDRCNSKTSLLTGIFTTGACSYLVSAIIGGIIMGKYFTYHSHGKVNLVIFCRSDGQSADNDSESPDSSVSPLPGRTDR